MSIQVDGRSVDIDAAKVASGVLDMVETMPDEYASALRIGMLPGPLMAILDECLRDKGRKERFSGEALDEFVAKCSREIASEILAQSDMVV